ncbi:MAG: formylglycine-generating enzyme family protein, partial [Xanthomonadaceae bacterium]|nr:formylglycine-generating enzyme family protein [Xanthomonadaceae bacterium]
TGRIAALAPPEPTQPVAADATEEPAETLDTPEVPSVAPEFEAPEPVDPPFHDRLRSGGQGPRMVALPAGTFMMGVRGSSDPAETPAHPAAVPAFAISIYEVTFAEYDRFARATGRRVPPSDGLNRARHPVFGVSWQDATAYAAWLSRETGHAYSLPSEAQWEYAASAGSTGPYWWGYSPPQGRAHCFNCTVGLPSRHPVPVGSFEPNRLGLFDTVGNVAEWVQDCFHPNYRNAPADGRVWEGGDCSVRVVRGGHYASPTPTAQKRDRFAPDRGYPDIGFRVVRQL